MKNAFIGNCSHSEGPLIDLLREKGYLVTAVGADRDAAYADKVDHFDPIDYRDTDHLARLFERKKFDCYIPASNELFLQSLTDLGMGETFGLGSNSLLQKMIRKDWLSEAFGDCSTLQILERRAITQKELSPKVLNASYSYYGDFFLKRNVSAGGRGVFLFNSFLETSEFNHRFSKFSSETGWIIEPSISGPEFSICCIVVNGKMAGFYWDREVSNPEFHTIDLSFWDNTLLPAWLDGATRDLDYVIKSFNFSDGIFHIQVIEHNGKPYVVDVTRRLPGDLYGLEVKAVTGFDLNSFFLNSLTKDSDFIFDQGALSSFEYWRPFFRFVCLNRSNSFPGLPFLKLSKYFDELAPKIYSCFKSGGFKSSFTSQRRLFICHFSHMPFPAEFLKYEFFSDAYAISWRS